MLLRCFGPDARARASRRVKIQRCKGIPPSLASVTEDSVTASQGCVQARKVELIAKSVLSAADGTLFLASASQDKYARLWALVPEGCTGSTSAGKSAVPGERGIVDGEEAAGSYAAADASQEPLGNVNGAPTSMAFGGRAVDITRCASACFPPFVW